VLSQKTILQERIAFGITSAMQRLVESSPLFEAWRRSSGIRYETGSIFNQRFPLPNPSRDLGLSGIYNGPIVLINDALSYGTTDFFASGFQDNGIGSSIGTDTVSGAGDANVWSHWQLQRLAAEAGGQGLIPLPGGVNINVALRRSTRVGFNEEIPVEGLGVFADHHYKVTSRDVMGRTEDLVTFTCHVLSQQ
jgi:hypothetical protein